MNVNELQRLIETLQKSISDHREELAESEIRTRTALVDPLLGGLGWDMANLNHVKREYGLGSGYKADYALFKDGQKKPAVLVEAKKLSRHTTGQEILPGEPEITKLPTTLRDAAVQGLSYCLYEEIQYVAVTDGLRWYIFDACKGGFMAKKLIASFDVMSPTATEDCLQARALWRHPIKPPMSESKPSKKEETQRPLPLPFINGQRVDDDGYVLTKSGVRDKRYTVPYPPGTKWVVDGFPLNKEGWVLTPKGNRATKFKIPCPTDTKRIVDLGPDHRHFLNAEGYVLTKNGKRDKRYPKPYPPGAVEFVDELPVDEEGWVLTKSGVRDKRYTVPYYS